VQKKGFIAFLEISSYMNCYTGAEKVKNYRKLKFTGKVMYRA